MLVRNGGYNHRATYQQLPIKGFVFTKNRMGFMHFNTKEILLYMPTYIILYSLNILRWKLLLTQ